MYYWLISIILKIGNIIIDDGNNRYKFKYEKLNETIIFNIVLISITMTSPDLLANAYRQYWISDVFYPRKAFCG